jgi:hypothetical protein
MMSAFPQISLLDSLFFIRKNESLFSQADNTKLLPLQVGIYKGFVPSAIGSNKLRISIGSDDINLAVIKTDTGYSLTFKSVDQYDLDFTGHTVFPVYVVLEGSFDLVNPTSGRILTVSAVQPHHVKICKVTGISGGNVTFTVVEGVDRDVGLLPAVGVPLAVNDTANVGSSIRYARADHVHEGVHRIIAGSSKVVITPSSGLGDVTIDVNIAAVTEVPSVVTTSVYRDTVSAPRGTPVSYKKVGTNKGVVRSDSATLATFPCVGLLKTNNPTTGSSVDIVTNGEAVANIAVFNVAPSDSDIGKPVYVASGLGKLAFGAAPAIGAVQRVGFIKDVVGSDVTITVSVSPDVFEDIGG